MELKDFFAKQRPPKDYVSFPPQETPTLEKFFAERTPKPEPEANMFGKDFMSSREYLKPQAEAKAVARPITPELKAIADVTPKLDSETLMKAKNVFNVQQPSEAPMQTEQPMQEMSQSIETPVSRSSLLDMNRVRQQADELAPQASWSDVAMGLIPVAIDAMSGGYGDALDVSGKYYMDKAATNEKRKFSLEDKLMEIEKARDIASTKAGKGSKNFQTVNIVDESDGSVIKANFDKDTGKYYSPDGKPLNSEKIRAGYSVIPQEWSRRAAVTLENAKTKADYTPRLDPETGLYSRATEAGMAPIGVQKTKLNPKQEKDLTQISDKFISSDTFKKPAAALSVATNIDSLLDAANSGNASAANSARVQMARMSGDVGALSDTDIERTGGSPSIKSRIKRFANLQRTGVPLTPVDIAELKEIARIYEANARFKMDSAIGDLDKSYVSEYGGIAGAVKNKLKAYIPSGSSNIAPTQGKVRVISPSGETGSIPVENLEKALKSGYKRI